MGTNDGHIDLFLFLYFILAVYLYFFTCILYFALNSVQINICRLEGNGNIAAALDEAENILVVQVLFPPHLSCTI